MLKNVLLAGALSILPSVAPAAVSFTLVNSSSAAVVTFAEGFQPGELTWQDYAPFFGGTYLTQVNFICAPSAICNSGGSYPDSITFTADSAIQDRKLPQSARPFIYVVQSAVFRLSSNATAPASILITLPGASGGVVPEPASWAMMLAGFGMIGGALRRRRAAVRFA